MSRVSSGKLFQTEQVHVGNKGKTEVSTSSLKADSVGESPNQRVGFTKMEIYTDM